MIPRLLFVTLLLVATAGLALPAAAEQADQESESAPFGQELSAAVQSTDAAASGEVSDGVFEARLERANESEREAILQERTEELDQRADRVERQLDSLEAANGSVDPANDSFVAGARASAVLAHLAAVRQSTNLTERRAADVGVDAPGVARVRDRTDELRGRETAGTARSVAFVPPGLRGDGPAVAGDGPRGQRSPNASAADDQDRSSENGGGPPADTPAGGADDGSNGDRSGEAPGNADGNGAENGNGAANGRNDAGDGAGNADGRNGDGADNADGARAVDDAPAADAGEAAGPPEGAGLATETGPTDDPSTAPARDDADA